MISNCRFLPLPGSLRYLLLLSVTMLVASPGARPAAAQSSMFSDFRATRAGDVLTIVLAENTSARRQSEWANESQSSAGGAATVGNGGSIDGKFGLDATFKKDGSNKNRSVQSDLLAGTMTARVDSVDPTGNLHISGERTLSVNGEIHVMKLSGLVRRFDVQPSNTIMSYQIASANIEYERKGGMKRALFKPGKAARFGGIALLVAGFLFAK
ncbi:MAG: flagellar basal body L-ring protein FlgH [Rhodothermales bacterium]